MPNNQSGTAAWQNRTSAYLGMPVVKQAANTTLDNAWLIEAVSPVTDETLAFIGLDVATDPLNLDAVTLLETVSAAGTATVDSQLLAVTAIFQFPTVPPLLGFSMYTTVFDADPTRFLVVAASILAGVWWWCRCGRRLAWHRAGVSPPHLLVCSDLVFCSGPSSPALPCPIR